MSVNIGDTVVLKSGSSPMTVVQMDELGVHPNPRARCVWQGGDQWFPLVALVKQEAPVRREVVTEHDWGEWPPQLTDKLPGDLA